MGNKTELTLFGLMSVLLTHIVLSQGFVFVEGRTTPLKTIESEDGEVIDCIDIYKQSAFDHPLLKNHTLQMRPSSFPNGMEVKDSFTATNKLSQNWHKSGRCPDGTIPIRRTPINPNLVRKKYHGIHNFTHEMQQDNRRDHEHAVTVLSGGNYYGTKTIINAWKPYVEPHEFSLSQIWVRSGEGANTNSIEAGWIVYKDLYGDYEPRMFSYWTSDNYQKTGCYNARCPGFEHTNKNFPLDARITPTSSYDGSQYDTTFHIFKDRQSGDWWLEVQGNIIGYWPKSIFTSLASRATAISWGGEVVNQKAQGGLHTTTEMGSGHFPSEGLRKASFFRNILVIDESYDYVGPAGIYPVATNPECYDVHLEEVRINSSSGGSFFYGGPGRIENSEKCT